jgi:SagB-type dehydrogenase family enzyme
MLSAIQYHERTKHHPGRYARSPGFLDWANEPDPFRRYEGSLLLSLPLHGKDPDLNYHDLYERRDKTIRDFSAQNISTLLEFSLGLSAWKSYGGSSWALRMNPSSGNLHPTEAHLILPPLPETNNRGGVYHYNPFLHALEQRTAFDGRFWSKIRDYFRMDGFFVGLSSICWRESWKYGERAFRYCNHDIGHAMACLSFAGNLLGWKTTYLNALSDKEIEFLLGFQKVQWRRSERENPELLLFVYKNSGKDIPRDIPPEIIEEFRSFSYSGEPNRLSNEHRDWQVIDQVSTATVKPGTPETRYSFRGYEFFEKELPSTLAAEVIRRRRSAVAFDGKTALQKRHFFGMLDKTIPRPHSAPFDLEGGEPSVHLLIFVHRISGLEPGLYFFLRNERDPGELKQKCRPDFLWERVDGASDPLQLYLLKKGDFRNEGAAAG